jgi:hypothetical protein
MMRLLWALVWWVVLLLPRLCWVLLKGLGILALALLASLDDGGEDADQGRRMSLGGLHPESHLWRPVPGRWRR